jgi:hypothetical protein
VPLRTDIQQINTEMLNQNSLLIQLSL